MDKCIWLGQYDNLSATHYFFNVVCARYLGYGFEHSTSNDKMFL